MNAPHSMEQLAAHHALDSLPPAWKALAHGQLTVEEAVAQVGTQEPPAVVAVSRMLFVPPSPALQEQRLTALLDAHFPAPAPSRSRWWGIAVMVAAAVLLVLLIPRPGTESGGSEVEPLARYTLELSRGVAGLRAGEAAPTPSPAVYVEGRPVELRLRPARSVTGPIHVVIFARDRAGRVVEPSVRPRINEHGVVHIVETTRALGLGVGRWDLTVVVGPGPLPSTLAEVEPGGRPEDAAPYDVLTTTLEVVPARGSSPP